MEKTTKNLFIASAALYAVWLAVGFVVVTFFWDSVCGEMGLIKDLKPILPINLIFSVITMVIAFLFVQFKSDNKSIMPEMLVLVFLCGVVPVLSDVLTQVQTIYLNGLAGSEGIVSLSYTTRAFSYASVLCSIGQALVLVALGMRIAQKTLLKNEGEEI